MVGVASAAGGPSMKITGHMDTRGIEQGFNRVKNGLKSTKGQANSFNADLMRMSAETGKLVKRLGALTVIGAGAMVGLASKAPAVAPALAKMGVQFERLQRTLGQALAPAFERVGVMFEKFVNWVDGNQDTIREVSGHVLDFAEKVGKFLYPALEKVGNFARDNPKLFAGIVAGLVLAPAVLTGIKAVGGLATTLGGVVVSASLLSALGYLALIGGAGYIAYKGANAMVDKLHTYTGMTGEGVMAGGTDMSGQTLVNRLPQQISSSITGRPTPWNDPMNPNSPAHFAMIEEIKSDARNNQIAPGSSGVWGAAQEQDRRFFLLNWWDMLRG